MTPEDFARADRSLGEMLDGARRPLRVRLKDPEVEAGVDEHGTYIRCTFELPRGAFATTVMDEVLKGEAARGHV
jgi:tRNA(Glu) U13 pseudouridine synthase TruD